MSWSTRAVALGWAAGDVVVVDRDLGVSAKNTDGREGLSGWWRTLAWERLGSCWGSRCRVSLGAMLTGINYWICAP
jgi:hypothetical protein